MSPEDALAANRERQRVAALHALQWQEELRRLRTEERALARRINEAVPILRLILGNDDVRPNVLRADRLGIVALWRLRGVCHLCRGWADAALAVLPRVTAIGGRLFEPENDDSDQLATDTVESLDLRTMKWSEEATIPPLQLSRSDHTACRLQDGRVVVAGGWQSFQEEGERATSAELWRPSATQWEPLPDLPEMRWYHEAVALSKPDRVLLLGGYTLGLQGNYRAVASVRSLNLDPMANRGEGQEELSSFAHGWVALQPMKHARANFAAAVLPCGDVLVVGGEGDSADPYVNPKPYVLAAELYDPRANAWSELPPMSVARCRPACTVLPSGTVAVFGGEMDQTGGSGEAFDPVQRIWVQLPTAGLRARGSIETYAAPVAGGLVVLGGLSRKNDYSGEEGNELARAQLFDEFTRRWYDMPRSMTMATERVNTQLVV
jgi:hypothetical protein